MGGIIDPGFLAGLAGGVQRATHSPGIQQLLNQLKNSYKYAGGPLSAGPSLGAQPSHLSSYNNSVSNVGAAGAKVGGALSALFGNQQDSASPMVDLYSQLLEQLQQPVNAPTGINREDLMNQVKAALNPIYDQRIQAATNQSQKGQAEVKNMYASLAQDYKDLAPQAAAQSQAAQQQIKDLYGQLRSNIEGSYSRVSQDQADLFKQLGIDSALPSVLEQQNPAVTDALTAASQNQASEQQAYLDQGQANQTYYNEQAPISNMRGNEDRANLISQLQDYVNQANAERTSGIQSGYMDQLGQAQNQLAQQQQTANSENDRRQQMLWQILQSQNSVKSQPLTPDTFLGSLAPQDQQSVASAFTQLQRSPEAVYGKVEDPRNPVPGTYVATTPEWYYSQADKMFQDGKIDQQTHQALLEYLQLYFGGK